MRFAIHPFLIILFLLTMLLVSACRTARSVAKEEQATQAAEVTQSSVAYDSSYARLFHALSLRADSIVLWMQPSVDGRAATVAEEGQCHEYDSCFGSVGIGRTEQSFATQKSGSTPQVAKVVIAGLQLESVAKEQKQSASLARDSLSVRESHQSFLSESMEEEPPNLRVRVYIVLFMLVAAIIAVAVLYIKRKFFF